MDNDTDIVRVTRILTYEGPRKWIETTLDAPSAFVPRVGIKIVSEPLDVSPRPPLSIRSVIVGEPQRVIPRASSPADRIVETLERVKEAGHGD